MRRRRGRKLASGWVGPNGTGISSRGFLTVATVLWPPGRGGNVSGRTEVKWMPWRTGEPMGEEGQGAGERMGGPQMGPGSAAEGFSHSCSGSWPPQTW